MCVFYQFQPVKYIYLLLMAVHLASLRLVLEKEKKKRKQNEGNYSKFENYLHALFEEGQRGMCEFLFYGCAELNCLAS